jgi:hypothetical protein
VIRPYTVFSDSIAGRNGRQRHIRFGSRWINQFGVRKWFGAPADKIDSSVRACPCPPISPSRPRPPLPAWRALRSHPHPPSILSTPFPSPLSFPCLSLFIPACHKVAVYPSILLPSLTPRRAVVKAWPFGICVCQHILTPSLLLAVQLCHHPSCHLSAFVWFLCGMFSVLLPGCCCESP